MNTIVCGGLLVTVCLALATALPAAPYGHGVGELQPVHVVAVAPAAEELVAAESAWRGHGHYGHGHHGGGGHHYGNYGHQGGFYRPHGHHGYHWGR